MRTQNSHWAPKSHPRNGLVTRSVHRSSARRTEVPSSQPLEGPQEPSVAPMPVSGSLAMVLELAEAWRARATLISPSLPDQATAYLGAAKELTAALEASGATRLTLEQAAMMSGYSSDHLGALVRRGDIPQAGQPNAPRIHFRDLPKRTRRSRQGVS